MIYEINSISKEFFPGMWHFNGINEDTHIVVKSLDGEILDRKSFIVSDFDRNKINEKANLNFK